MEKTLREVWDLDELIFDYAEKHNLNPRKFGDRFKKEFLSEISDCECLYKFSYIDVCFNKNVDFDKSLIDFMGLDVPLGENVVCVTFSL
jgi:hypothetical protein